MLLVAASADQITGDFTEIRNYSADYIDPMESVHVCIALFLRQGFNMYLQCECRDEQFFVLVINHVTCDLHFSFC